MEFDKDDNNNDNNNNKDNTKQKLSLDIKKEVLDRMQSILCIIVKYDCDKDKKYKNMINYFITINENYT